MARHQTDLLLCRKQDGIAFGRTCEKCDGKCVICDSHVHPCTLVRICDECNYGTNQGRCVVCGNPGVSDAYYCKECVMLEKDALPHTMSSVRPMYGGAMEMQVPGAFIDVSDLRQVPDNQEVWADMTTSQTAVLEILELVPGQEGQAAADFHFRELGVANGCAPDEVRVLEVREMSAAELPHFQDAVSRHYLHGEQIAGKFNEKSKNVVNIDLLLIRLAAPASADLLLTLNTPTQVNPSSSEAQFSTATESPFPAMAKSLKINDPSLFVPME